MKSTNAVRGTLPQGCAVRREYNKILWGFSFLFFSYGIARIAVPVASKCNGE